MNMKACDEKLRAALMEAWELENARLEEEMKKCEPHVFSDEFERKMDELFEKNGRKRNASGFRGRWSAVVKYSAIAAIVFILTGGIFVSQSPQLNASNLSVDILEWLGDFFTVKDGDANGNAAEALFCEEQIGYLPEGFVLVSEWETFSQVRYEYEGENGKYVVIHICENNLNSNVDNEDILKKVCVNQAGYEYTMLQGSKNDKVVIIWKDVSDIYYYITSNLDADEVIKIMDHIS